MGRHSIPDDDAFRRSLTISALKWAALAIVPVIAAFVLYNVVKDRRPGDDQPKAPVTESPQAKPTSTLPPVASSPTVTSTVKPTSTPTGSGTKVQVLNGTPTEGLLVKMRDELRKDGYDVVSTGKAARSYDKTTIFYQAGFKANAEAVADYLGLGEVAVAPSNLDKSIPLTVVVGTDYKG